MKFMAKTNEYNEQVTIFNWASLMANMHPELNNLFAIPNGAKLAWRKNSKGQRYAPEALRLLKSGMKPGVPDMFLAYPSKNYAGLFVELKVNKNKPTKEQLEWMERLSKAGYMCAVCYGAEEAIKTISEYLGINKREGF